MILQCAEKLEEDHDALANMRFVCTRWRDGVSSARISLQPKGFDEYARTFWRPKRLDFSSRYFSPVMQRKDLDVFNGSMSGVEHCILNHMQHVTSLSSLTRAQGLRELSLDHSNVTDSILGSVLEICTRLETLSVQGCMFLRGEWIESLRHTPHVRTLKMGGCGMDLTRYWSSDTSVLQKLCGLETLVLMGNGVSDECINVLSHCLSLTYLDIRRCSDVTYHSLYTLSTFESLKTLKIGPLFHCSLDDIWQAIPKFKSLCALEIYGQMDRPSSSLADLLDRDLWHMPPLQKLSLMNTYYDWSTIKALSIACGQTLEYINLGQSRPGDVAQRQQCTVEPLDATFPKLVCLKAVHSLLPLNAINALLISSPGLEVLDLSGCPCLKPSRSMWRRTLWDGQQQTSNIVDDFARALGSLARLKSLSLQNACIEDAHLAHIGMLTDMTTMDISNNPGLANVSLYKGALWKCINIVNTSISLPRPHGLFAKTLEEFCVSGNMCDISGDDIYRFVSGCGGSRMQKLHMRDIQHMEDSVLQHIVESCPNITDLSLAGCRSISRKGLQCITYLRKLAKLDISRLRETVSDENLEYILKHTCLSELRVSGAELSPCSLKTLLESRMLHYIDISFCFGIGTDDDCTNMVQKSGSPVKIRLPQGSTRLGLHDPEYGSQAQRRLAF